MAASFSTMRHAGETASALAVSGQLLMGGGNNYGAKLQVNNRGMAQASVKVRSEARPWLGLVGLVPLAQLGLDMLEQRRRRRQQQHSQQQQQQQQHQLAQAAAQFGLDDASLLQLQQEQQLAALTSLAGGTQWGANGTAVANAAAAAAAVVQAQQQQPVSASLLPPQGPPPGLGGDMYWPHSGADAGVGHRRAPARSMSTSYLQPRMPLGGDTRGANPLASLGLDTLSLSGGNSGLAQAAAGLGALPMAIPTSGAMPPLGGGGGLDAGRGPGAALAESQQLLDGYTSSSWQTLELAQQAASGPLGGGGRLLEQLSSETALVSAAAAAVDRIACGTAAGVDAAAELGYLALLARQHVGAYARLSTPAALAVQLLANIVQVVLSPSALGGDAGARGRGRGC